MADSGNMTRREALRQSVLLAVFSTAGGLAVGCSKKDDKPKELSCSDTSSLPPADVEMRMVTMQYVEKTPDPAKRCDNCQQFKPAPAADQCGGCTVVKGPINPAGWCKAWVAKQPS